MELTRSRVRWARRGYQYPRKFDMPDLLGHHGFAERLRDRSAVLSVRSASPRIMPQPWGGGPAMPCPLRPLATLPSKGRSLHHNRMTPKRSNTGSTETTGISRAKAWAASIRSNGSR